MENKTLVKTKKKPKNKNYFTKRHEQAIIDFNSSTNNKKRNKLYIKVIQPAFAEMVEKIVYRYKFTNLPNINSLIEECQGHLITILHKYDPEKNSKAFSYFTRITINWFIHKAKKFSAQMKKEVQHEEISKAIEVEFLSTTNDYDNKREHEEFFAQLKEELEMWECQNLKPNEVKVLQAIKFLFAQPDAIDIFNKKGVYIYCRELTGLNTKQVLNNLNKFRTLYKDFKSRWDNGYYDEV